jgi:hypothetical protein
VLFFFSVSVGGAVWETCAGSNPQIPKVPSRLLHRSFSNHCCCAFWIHSSFIPISHSFLWRLFVIADTVLTALCCGGIQVDLHSIAFSLLFFFPS